MKNNDKQTIKVDGVWYKRPFNRRAVPVAMYHHAIERDNYGLTIRIQIGHGQEMTRTINISKMVYDDYWRVKVYDVLMPRDRQGRYRVFLHDVYSDIAGDVHEAYIKAMRHKSDR